MRELRARKTKSIGEMASRKPLRNLLRRLAPAIAAISILGGCTLAKPVLAPKPRATHSSKSKKQVKIPTNVLARYRNALVSMGATKEYATSLFMSSYKNSRKLHDKLKNRLHQANLQLAESCAKLGIRHMDYLWLQLLSWDLAGEEIKIPIKERDPVKIASAFADLKTALLDGLSVWNARPNTCKITLERLELIGDTIHVKVKLH